MCRAMFRAGKQDFPTTLQSIYSLHRWPSLQRRNENCWRMVKTMLSYCSEMLVLGTNWKTWYSSGQWTNLHDRWRNRQSLWLTPESIDFLHSSHKWITNNSVMWVILLSNADWDCFKIPTSQEILRNQNPLRLEHCGFFWSHTFVPRSWMCKKQTCKKQTSVSHSSTESAIICLDVGLRLHGIPALDLWVLIVCVLGNNSDPRYNGATRCEPWQRSRAKQAIKEWSTFGIILSLQTSNFRMKKLCCMCLKTTKQWFRWLSKEGVPQWDCFQDPKSCSCLFDRINLDSKIQVKYIDTKKLTRNVMSGIISWIWKTLAISVLQFVLKPWQKITTSFRKRTRHSEITTNDEPYCKGSLELVIFDFSKPQEEKLWESESLEFESWERG